MQTFGTKRLYEEPYAEKLQVRFCEGQKTSSHLNK